MIKYPHHCCPPWEAGCWILRIIYLGPHHMLRDPVIHTDVLFPMLFISQENWRFLFQGLICQALSSSHLTVAVSSPWATLATHLSVKPRWFLQMRLEAKQFVWGRLCFFASRKRLIIFLPKQALGGQKEPVFRGWTASLIRVCVIPLITKPDRAPITVG